MPRLALALLLTAGCSRAPSPSPPGPPRHSLTPDPDPDADRVPDPDPDADPVPDPDPDLDSPVGPMHPDLADAEIAIPLDQIDTSVAPAEVRQPRARWPQRFRKRAGDRVALVLHAGGDGMLRISALDGTGVATSYAIRPCASVTDNDTMDGNTYPAFDRVTGEGPLLFAVRVLPRPGAEEAERRQIAVYAEGASVRVVEKRVTGSAWWPRLRIDFDAGATFVAIGTLDPH